MKKARHVFISILVVCIYISFLLPRSGMEANETLWETAYLENIGITTSFGGDIFQLSVIYPSGQDENLTVPAPIYWNGTPIYDYNELDPLPLQQLIKFSKNTAGIVDNVISTQEPAQLYTSQTYNSALKQFHNSSIDNTLPIFYKRKDANGTVQILEPYLQDGYIYDLEVIPSYGIFITKMRNTSSSITIEKINYTIADDINGKIVQVDVSFDTTSPGMTCFKLYDSNLTLLETKKTATGSAIFSALENKDADYYIEISRDQSDTRTIAIHTSQTTTQSAYLKDIGTTFDFGKSRLELQVYLPDGTQQVFKCADSIYVDGQWYDDTDELIPLLMDKTIFAFVQNAENKIVCLRFPSEQPAIYTTQSYNPLTEKFNNPQISQLPIFYRYTTKNGNNLFAEPTLSENYVYNLEVYPYGIVITKLKSTTSNVTIEWIDYSIRNDFDSIQLQIQVFYDEAVQGDTKCELYDSNQTLVAENASPTDIVILNNLTNTDASYTLTICQIGQSDSRAISVETKKCMTETAYLDAVGSTSSFGKDIVQLRLCSADSTCNLLVLDDYIYLNGIWTNDYSSFLQQPPIGQLIQYLRNDSGEIVALRFDSQVQTYTFQSYNAETKYFTNPDLMASLPILKKYTELDDIPYFETPMLKEGQLYNLTVNSCGIIVTEIIDAKNTGPWYLSNIQTDGQTLTVDLNKTAGDERNPPIILLAVYGENGELLKTKTYSIQSDTTQYRMPLEASLKPKNAKAFLLKDADTLVPAAICISAAITD